MSKYIFNARDIAAYFKYFNVPQYLEVSYMQYIFNIGSPLMAAPLCKDFEKFKSEVYRELYYLWALGFEDEKSDISCVTSGGDRSLICDQDCIVLETYMKLITLHLIFTKNLPYVNLNFAGIPLSLGIECDFDVFENNVVKCIESLNLVSKDRFGKDFDLKLGVPDELLQISLADDFKYSLVKQADIRDSLRKEQKDKMSELKEKSLKVFENIGLSKKQDKKKIPSIATNQKPVVRKTLGEKANRSTTSRNQPKGAPLEDIRHKDGE
ncbi:MAG: hypothetical protein MJ094_08665 [Saccharofermentans sp.]|nr:hypothetical protein [Saccharofermentans sp.]